MWFQHPVLGFLALARGMPVLVRFNDCIYISELELMPLPLSAAGNNYHRWGMPASWRCVVVSLSVADSCSGQRRDSVSCSRLRGDHVLGISLLSWINLWQVFTHKFPVIKGESIIFSSLNFSSFPLECIGWLLQPSIIFLLRKILLIYISWSDSMDILRMEIRNLFRLMFKETTSKVRRHFFWSWKKLLL